MNPDFETFLRQDKFAQFLGIEILEVGPGWAKARLLLREDHLNIHRTVHGGTLFSLADAVFSAASNSHGPAAVAINATVSFLRAINTGFLFAEAKEISLNKTLAIYDVRVVSETGDLISTFQGMVYRKNKKEE